jgi:hypothetical protein
MAHTKCNFSYEPIKRSQNVHPIIYKSKSWIIHIRGYEYGLQPRFYEILNKIPHIWQNDMINLLEENDKFIEKSWSYTELQNGAPKELVELIPKRYKRNPLETYNTCFTITWRGKIFTFICRNFRSARCYQIAANTMIAMLMIINSPPLVSVYFSTNIAYSRFCSMPAKPETLLINNRKTISRCVDIMGYLAKQTNVINKFIISWALEETTLGCTSLIPSRHRLFEHKLIYTIIQFLEQQNKHTHILYPNTFSVLRFFYED